MAELRPPRDLQWRGWYQPRAVPWNNGGGMPVCQNVQPMAGNEGFRAIFGATRNTSKSTDGTYGTTAGIYTFNAGNVGRTVGTGLAAVVDPDLMASETIVAAAYHLSSTSIYKTSTTAQQALRRVKQHQYGTWVSLHGNTYYYDAENPVYCWDGRALRLAGIRPPRTRPYLSSQAASTTTLDAGDTGWTNGGSVTTVTHDSTDFKTGTASVKCVWSTQSFSGSLTLATKTVSVNLPTWTGRRHLGFWIKTSKPIPSDELILRLNSTDHSVGQDIEADVWTWVEVVTSLGSGTAITSVTFLCDPTSWEDRPITIRFDGVAAIDCAGTGAVTYYAGKFQAVYTWYDAARDRESAPSPPSPVFRVPVNPVTLQLNLNGETPEDSTNVLQLRVYLKILNTELAVGEATGKFHLVYQNTVSLAGDPVTIQNKQRVSGFLVLTSGAPLDQEAGGAIDYRGEPPIPGAAAVIHGDRIVSAVPMDDYTTGTVTATLGSDVVTGSGTSWQRFMEGMDIRMGSDAEVYEIVRVVSTTSLRISRTYTAYGVAASLDGSGYEGSTASGKTYRISPNRSVISWTSKFLNPATNIVESYSEGCATATNQMAIRPDDGDKIVGLGRAGTRLMVFKQNSTFSLVQNSGNTDDEGAYEDPDLVSDVIGCRARRSIAQDDRGSCVWLASNGSIVRSNGGSIETLVPGTWFGEVGPTNGFLDSTTMTEATIAESFGFYVPQTNRYYLFFYQESSTLGVCYDFANRILFKISTSIMRARGGFTAADDNGRTWLYLVDKSGHFWKWEDPSAENLGVGGTFVYTALSGTSTTVSIGSTIQPNATDGKDNHLTQASPTTNFGTTASAVMGTATALIVEFDLSSYVGLGITLGSAVLTFTGSCSFADAEVTIRRLTQSSWTESGSTWNTYDGTNAWTTPGGDYTATGAVGPTTWASGATSKSFTITALAQDAIDSRSGRLILHITQTDGTTLLAINTSDASSSSDRPALALTATPTFATTGDGLQSLGVTKIKATTQAAETQLISSNTASTITVGSAWTNTPVLGDKIILGAIESQVEFMEHYAPSGLSPVGLRIDAKYDSGLDFDVQMFTASGSKRFVDTSAAAQTKYLDGATLDEDAPSIPMGGGIFTRALRYRLHWYGQGDTFEVYNVAAHELVDGDVTK